VGKGVRTKTKPMGKKTPKLGEVQAIRAQRSGGGDPVKESVNDKAPLVGVVWKRKGPKKTEHYGGD